MATIYNFVCKTCKENYDIDKIHNAVRFIPILTEEHKRHDYFVYDEHNDKAINEYEYDGDNWEQPNKDYKQIDCFEYDKYKNSDKKISYEEFFNSGLLARDTFEDIRGNTCCVKCGDKIEGGYCSCYNKK